MPLLLRIAAKIDSLSRGVAVIARWGLLANALLITATAFGRTFNGVAWADAFDMQFHFFAAVVLLMAAYTLQRDEHVRIDIFAHRFGERGLAWLDLVGLVVVVIPICAAMVWLGWPQFVEAYVHGETRFSAESVSHLPAWIIEGLVPLGFLLLGLQATAEAIRCVAVLRGRAHRPVHRRQLLDGGEHDL